MNRFNHMPSDEDWLYLAALRTLFLYAMGERTARNLISQSLFRAVAAKRPSPGLIHHSDRGSLPILLS